MKIRGERRLWEDLRPVLSFWAMDPIRVENGLDYGTPDVSYSKGWIELKDSDVPARSSTPVVIDWQKGQKGWLARRWSVGGIAFLLLRVKDWYVLIDGWTCCKLDGSETLANLIDMALVATQDLRCKELRVVLDADVENMENYLKARWYRARSRMSKLDAAHSLSMPMGKLVAGESGLYDQEAEDLIEAWEV